MNAGREMLSNEVMGGLALWILWVNTLLIAGAAFQDLIPLWERRRRMKRVAGEGMGAGMGAGVWIGLARARVVRGSGDGGVIAGYRVEQVGRAGEGEQPVILFADRIAEGEVFGGSVRFEGSPSEVAIEAAGRAEGWLEREELAKAGACPSDEAFDAAYAMARKARGFSRMVAAGIGPEQDVFLFGHFRRSGAGLSLGPADDGRMVIASFDPRPWLDGKIQIIVLFIAAELAVAALCTLVALTPPYFGTVSKIGGALSLAFFLAVQPVGTMVREAVRTPDRMLLGGCWARRARVERAEPSVEERVKQSGVAV